MYENYESLDEEKRSLVRKHLELVLKANETLNLTRIEDVDVGMLLHVEDSLTALPEINEAPKGLYGDLGSGAGYPGIPLAIATGRNAVLIDSRAKKMDTVKGILDTMGLSDQIEVYAGRAELLARKSRGQYAALTARALSKLSVLLELASPLLVKGGRLICYKANVEDEEMENAHRVGMMVGMSLVSDRSFRLAGEYQRRILVFEKSNIAKIKLPRQEGAAQKRPL